MQIEIESYSTLEVQGFETKNQEEFLQILRKEWGVHGSVYT
jgi:hypothetical protein